MTVVCEGMQRYDYFSKKLNRQVCGYRFLFLRSADTKITDPKANGYEIGSMPVGLPRNGLTFYGLPSIEDQYISGTPEIGQICDIDFNEYGTPVKVCFPN